MEVVITIDIGTNLSTRSSLQGCGRSTAWTHQNSISGKGLFLNGPRIVGISGYMLKLVHSICNEGNE